MHTYLMSKQEKEIHEAIMGLVGESITLEEALDVWDEMGLPLFDEITF